ncbi:hypothetical protein BGX27_007722 [Mortierella sp. AM989]|nr:hypothetical protein BGX27_007722 [Mortierella sp. AM989]
MSSRLVGNTIKRGYFEVNLEELVGKLKLVDGVFDEQFSKFIVSISADQICAVVAKSCDNFELDLAMAWN